MEQESDRNMREMLEEYERMKRELGGGREEVGMRGSGKGEYRNGQRG